MTANPQSPFVRESLTGHVHAYDGVTGGIVGKEKLYELTPASVHPTAITGRDELGRPIEETRPPCYSRRFVHPDGSINWVPLRTGAVYSDSVEAQRYELITVRELISHGWLPLETCPYSHEFNHITRGALVAIPKTATAEDMACRGDEGALDGARRDDECGCKHLRAIIAKRRELAKERHAKDAKRMENLSREDVKALLAGVGDTISDAIQSNLAPADRKQRLMKDRSDGPEGEKR